MTFFHYLNSVMPSAELSQWAIHLVLAVVVMSLYTIAALQAFVWLSVEHFVRKNPSRLVTYSLPSLERIEKFLFRFLAVGFIFLTLLLLMTLPWFYHAAMMSHVKWIIAGLTWLLFLLLLLGHYFLGWRGKFLIRWMSLGISSLVILTTLSGLRIII